MRTSPVLRLGLGAGLAVAVLLAVLLLMRDGAEAPDNVIIPTVVTSEVAPTDAPSSPTSEAVPLPTADTQAQRAELLTNPRLAAVIEAVESADVDAIMSWTQTFNLCEVRYRDPWPECADAEHVDAVWQTLQPLDRPTPRTEALMRRWLISLFEDNEARLVLVGRDADGTAELEGVRLLLFQLPVPVALDRGSQPIDYLALRIHDGEALEIEEIGFSISEVLDGEAIDPGLWEINELALSESSRSTATHP